MMYHDLAWQFPGKRHRPTSIDACEPLLRVGVSFIAVVSFLQLFTIPDQLRISIRPQSPSISINRKFAPNGFCLEAVCNWLEREKGNADDVVRFIRQTVKDREEEWETGTITTAILDERLLSTPFFW